MVHLKTSLPLVILFLYTSNLFTQENQYIDHVIDSRVFEKEREVKVMLPERYFRDTTTEFIVTYVLDAQSDEYWSMATGNISYLVRQHQVIPMIAVGIVSPDRGGEFSPKSEVLSRHLEEEVFPLIEQSYRVADFRIIIGHSWGGAFVGNTLFSAKRDMFDAYIGISPSLGAIDGRILHHADSILRLEQPVSKYFYCSSGDLGIREFESQTEIMEMDSIIQAHPNPTLVWEYEVFPDMDHWSCVIPSFNNGLVNACRNFFADQKIIKDLVANGKDIKKAIDQFYQQQQATYGFIFKPSYKYWDFVADDFRQLELYETAIALYLFSIEEGNENVVCYYELAQSYEAKKDTVNAHLYYQKTNELLEQNKENLKSSLYQALKKEVAKKLKH